MQIITDLGGISRVQFSGIRQMLSQRISQLELREGEALADVGAFFVVQPGDTISDLEKASGCPIVTDLFGNEYYGSPDFAPSFEWLEYHQEQQCFEIAFMMTDDYFVAVFVPDDPGIDPELLRFCREYS